MVLVAVALRLKFETIQFIMGQKQCFQVFISVSLRYEMRPVMCILLCGVLGKIPRFMGEFGPRKARPDNDEGSSFSAKRHLYIHGSGPYIRARSGSSNPTPWRRTRSLEFLFECTVGALN
jgi:hypothetical protein